MCDEEYLLQRIILGKLACWQLSLKKSSFLYYDPDKNVVLIEALLKPQKEGYFTVEVMIPNALTLLIVLPTRREKNYPPSSLPLKKSSLLISV